MAALPQPSAEGWAGAPDGVRRENRVLRELLSIYRLGRALLDGVVLSVTGGATRDLDRLLQPLRSRIAAGV